MRKYTPKDNVQGKAKYTDRFWVAPRVPRESVETDEHFAAVDAAVRNRSRCWRATSSWGSW